MRIIVIMSNRDAVQHGLAAMAVVTSVRCSKRGVDNFMVPYWVLAVVRVLTPTQFFPVPL